MIKNGIYSNDIQGKKEFTENILIPFVENENHFKTCRYVCENHNEWIELVPWSCREKIIKINVTADSLEAMIRDFCRQFIKIIEEMY